MGTTTVAAGSTDQFSRQDLRRILHLSERQLSAWQRQGLVPETAAYTFSDLIALKTIQKLRENKIPLKRIQRSLEALRQKLGEVEHPLTELKISSDGRRILVGYAGATMEPLTGQLLFDFQTRHLESSVRAFKPAPRTQSEDAERRREAARLKQEAEAWFWKGLQLEENPEKTDEAMEAYRQAIELNPEAAGAYINLGTIFYNRHRLSDAENCYRAAIQIDPHYALAFFNLGNVYDEQGKLAEARNFYEEALRLQPEYADAHYNLALVYEKLDLRAKGAHHWRRYLKLDPASPWAAYARQQLARSPFQVLSRGDNPDQSHTQ